MFSQSKVMTSQRSDSWPNNSRFGELAFEDGRHLAAGRARVTVEKQEFESEWIAGQRHHAPELAGADDADGHCADPAFAGSGLASTLAV